MNFGPFAQLWKAVLLEILVLIPGAGYVCPTVNVSAGEAQAQFAELDRRAQVEFRHGALAEAADDFRQAECFAPDGVRSYYDLYAVAARRMAAGDFPAARQALTEADRLRPGYVLPLAMLVKVSLAAQDVEGLKQSLTAVAQRFPHDARLHAELAQDLIHQKQYDLGLAELLRCEQDGSLDAKSAINLAVLANQLGAFGDAIRYAAAVEGQTNLPDRVRGSAASIAGLSYESLEQLQESVPHLRLAIRLSPSEEKPYLALARILEKQHETKGALDVLEAGLRQVPDSPDLALALGATLVEVEQFRKAGEILAALIARFPDEVEAYPKLAGAYRNMGEPALATSVLRKLAERRPGDQMLHVVIAQSLLDEDPVDYAAVLRELAQAEKAAPDDYDVHYLLGKTCLAMREYDQAAAALRRAIEIRPMEAGAYYQLGLVYRKSGKMALAKEQFERVEFLKAVPDQAPSN